MSPLGCLLSASLVFNLVLLVIVSATSSTKSNKRGRYEEAWVSGKGANKIAMIQVDGTITGRPTSYSDTASARILVKQLRRARRDASVKGVFIEINSPGGSVTASDKIYQAMVKLRKSKKPIVLLMGDTCASGCVYMGVPANKVYAHPTTITGSIGVIISTLNFSKMMEKIGIQGVTIASKENKALLSPYAPVQESHKKILKDIVDEMHTRFVGIVAKWRKLPTKEVSAFADGRVFSAKQAKKLKLIDGISYRQQALKSLLKLAGLKNARYVRYKRQVNFFDLFKSYAKLPAELKKSRKISIDTMLDWTTPKAYYLWHPTSSK
tara:strand:+ start:33558 stop:34526 length:969 start_codon:yes stop_codon:yes gene_type:complete